jgi:RNA polymerase sigma-70 factor (ECF subfamily)
MPAPSLEALLSRSGAGDTEAFAALYEELAPRVYGLALKVLRDPHQAEEVAQEAFLQIWQSAARFDPARGSARTWALTLTHRRAVDRVRASEAARARDIKDARLSLQAPRDVTSLAAHASFEAQRVRAVLATMTTKQRQVIELAYWGGHTHSEISQLLQIPLGTAKARIRDGLIRLRAGLTAGLADLADLAEPVTP